MPDVRDPFDDLRRPVVPLAPRPEFVASLRRRLQEEIGMTGTTTSRQVHGDLAMVHLRVDNADRAIAFFGSLFDWEAERVLFDEHVSHYTINTAMTVRLLDDPDAPPMVPNYAVADVPAAMAAVDAAGGRVTEAEPAPDGGGWARGVDDQGLPWLAYRPGRRYEHAEPTRRPTGEVGLVFIRADVATAESFYGAVLDWDFTRAHPDSFYFDTVERVGVFDEAAAFGTAIEPSATLYFSVDALAPVLARIKELGGTAGEPAQDMGPYFSAVCADDQGTTFGVMSAVLE